MKHIKKFNENSKILSKVISINDDIIKFDDGSTLESHHEDSCCEKHYLSTSDLTMEDFDGLEFDLTNDDFFTRVPDYGIKLNPVKGLPVNIPGYGYNNGYYSDNLSLILRKSNGEFTEYDITECQTLNEE